MFDFNVAALLISLFIGLVLASDTARVTFSGLPSNQTDGWTPGETIQFKYKWNSDPVKPSDMRVSIDAPWHLKHRLLNPIVTGPDSDDWFTMEATIPSDVKPSDKWQVLFETTFWGRNIALSPDFTIVKSRSTEAPPAPTSAGYLAPTVTNSGYIPILPGSAIPQNSVVNGSDIQSTGTPSTTDNYGSNDSAVAPPNNGGDNYNNQTVVETTTPVDDCTDNLPEQTQIPVIVNSQDASPVPYIPAVPSGFIPFPLPAPYNSVPGSVSNSSQSRNYGPQMPAADSGSVVFPSALNNTGKPPKMCRPRTSSLSPSVLPTIIPALNTPLKPQKMCRPRPTSSS